MLIHVQNLNLHMFNLSFFFPFVSSVQSPNKLNLCTFLASTATCCCLLPSFFLSSWLSWIHSSTCTVCNWWVTKCNGSLTKTTQAVQTHAHTQTHNAVLKANRWCCQREVLLLLTISPTRSTVKAQAVCVNFCMHKWVELFVWSV